ncbi:hypothetical protein BASA81_003954 [Batrachochytrium salamandrivorans]|nr:hypothetical protein BASA81_003954 [Batrachochytrium salamandrivorans]
MSRSRLVVLCTNLEQLHVVSRQLLEQLELRREQETHRTELGEVFLNTASLLGLFGQYAENHSNARNDLAVITKSTQFNQFWTNRERKLSTNADFASYLILPIQRVPRYLLLLKALLDNTPIDMSAEVANLTNAAQQVQLAAKFMNDCITRAEQKEQLRELQSKFVGGMVVDFIGGVGLAGYRALVWEGELVRITSKSVHRTYYFHLMNDALVYSRQVKDGYKFHRALTLTGTCSVHDVEDGILCQNQTYLSYTALEPYSRTRSCAFQIRTKDKAFIVYASNLQGKREWMTRLGEVIQQQAGLEVKLQDRSLSVTSSVASSSTLAGGVTADKCEMCQTSFYAFTKRVCCERCHLQVCGSCGGNFRFLPNGRIKPTTKLPVLPPCVWRVRGKWTAQRWTAVPTSSASNCGWKTCRVCSHLRLPPRAWCRAKHNGNNGKDAAEALKRLYFSLTFNEEEEEDGEVLEENQRGPSNCGTLGLIVLFPSRWACTTCPQLPCECTWWVSARLAQQCCPWNQWYWRKPWPVPSPTICGISSSPRQGIQPRRAPWRSRSRPTMRCRKKTGWGLRMGIRFGMSCKSPRAVAAAPSVDAGGEATPLQLGVHHTAWRGQNCCRFKPVPHRLRCRHSRWRTRLPADCSGLWGLTMHSFKWVAGGGVDQEETMREKLNVAFWASTSPSCWQNPVVTSCACWTSCTQTVWRIFGALAKQRADLYADTPTHLAQPLDELLQAQCAGVAAVPIRHFAVGSSYVVLLAQQALGNKETAARKALRGLSLRGKGDSELDEDEAGEQRAIMGELLEHEQAYVHALQVLDEVFVGRLLLLAQGASIRLSKTHTHDAWAEKMGFDGGLDELTTGIQTLSTGLAGKLPKPFHSPTKSQSMRFKRSTAANTGSEPSSSSDGSNAEDGCSRILSQPFVLVWLQTVRNIRLANSEFFTALKQRAEHTPNTATMQVGDLFERFCAIMPMYSAFASSFTLVLEELQSHKGLFSLLQACQADPQADKLPFAHYLSLPLHRVEQYSQALSKLLLINKTGTKDWDAMRSALGKMLDTTQHVERTQRRQANQLRLGEIQAEVDDWPVGFTLNPPQHSQRWLVREGWLLERQSTSEKLRYVWLFSDCICFATSAAKKRKTFHVLKQAGQGLLFGTNPSDASAASSSAVSVTKRFKFHQMFWLKQQSVEVRDMPQGGVTLAGGDVNAVAFTLLVYGGQAQQPREQMITLIVPSEFEYCTSRPGPAAVEQAKVKHKLGNEARRIEAPQGDREQVKLLWLDDLQVCVAMSRQGLGFEPEDQGKKERLASLRSVTSIALGPGSTRSLVLGTRRQSRRHSSMTSLLSEDCSVLEGESEGEDALDGKRASLTSIDEFSHQQRHMADWNNEDDEDDENDADDGEQEGKSVNRNSLASCDVRSVYKYSVTSLDYGLPLPPKLPLVKSPTTNNANADSNTLSVADFELL